MSSGDQAETYRYQKGNIVIAPVVPRDAAQKKLSLYELGKSYACWYDPDDPRTFVLRRGISWGWYLLFLGPLLLFIASSYYLHRKLRGPDAPSETSNTPIQ